MSFKIVRNINVSLSSKNLLIRENISQLYFVNRHRDSETRVTVKFVDRGDETFVDITELLQIDQALSTIPAFAQPFRLRGYEDSVCQTKKNPRIQNETFLFHLAKFTKYDTEFKKIHLKSNRSYNTNRSNT